MWPESYKKVNEDQLVISPPGESAFVKIIPSEGPNRRARRAHEMEMRRKIKKANRPPQIKGMRKKSKRNRK